MNQTLPFNTMASPVDGYRLVHLEIQNFGFYHGAHSFPLSRLGSVFTGENGAGKSTAVDAFGLLLFEQPAFNSASSENRRARNVESYYLGTYGEDEDRDGSGEVSRKRKKLRDFGSPIGATAILARFSTRSGKILTLARLLHMPSPQAYNWRNIVTDIEIGIDELLPFRSVREIQRRIGQPGTLVTEKNSAYFQRIANEFGFRDRQAARPAFQMLEKAIGAKTIPSLESFAQEHIFPLGDLGEVTEAVAKSLHAVREILNELQVDREKLTHLKRITGSFDVIERNEAQYADAVELARQSKTFEHILESLRWSGILSGFHAKLGPVEKRSEEIECEVGDLRDRLPVLEAAFRAAGGDKIELLESKLATERAELSARDARRQRFSDAVKGAGIGDLPEAPDVWARLPIRLQTQVSESEKAAQETEVIRDEAIGQLHHKIREKREYEAELASIRDTGSALGRQLVAFRTALAESLGIAPADIPFLGEMWEVQEKDWEGAANRAIGEIASHILVPGRHYQDAIRLLRSRHWGTKIDIRNADERQGRGWREQHAYPNALSTKIDVKPDHPLSEAARALLNGAADYLCVETDQELARGRAITKDGAVSLGSGHARKNDTRRIDDRSSWTLGWDHQARKTAIEAEIETLDAEIKVLGERRQQANDGAQRHRDRAAAAREAARLFQPFVEMDVAGAEARVRNILDQIDKIRNGSLEQTDRELRAARAKLLELGKERDQVIASMAQIKSGLETARRSLRIAHSNAREAQIKSGTTITLRAARILTNIGLGNTKKGEALNEAHPGAGHIRPRIQVDKQPMVGLIQEDEADRLRLADRRIRENSVLALGYINDFFNRWPEELGKSLQRQIDDTLRGAAHRKAWRDRRATIEFHDIKSLEEAIARRDRTTIFAALPKVTGAQQDYHSAIMALQSGINEVLSQTIYDRSKGSYARLEIQRKTNPVIGEFQKLLRECSTDLTELTTEEVYRRAGRFVDWIETADPRQREERVSKALDMRRWYTIRLVEYRKLEPAEGGEPREEVLDILTGAASKSGGEAERLSSFFMGAGISHAFGTCDPFRTTPPLQICIIDEAFKHCTDDTAKGAMTFLERLGLQLLLASPIEKVSAFEGFADRFYVVSKQDNQSLAQPIAYRDISPEMVDAPVDMTISEPRAAEFVSHREEGGA